MSEVSKSPHYTSYFDAVRDNVAKYGEKTVVLMMTGSFYEIYGLKDGETGKINDIPDFEEIVKITHLNAAEKTSGYDGKIVLQLGFRDYSLDKYLPIFNECGWTVAIYEQYEVAGQKHMERKLDRVFSPGTSFYTGEHEHSITNNIMCIWMKRTQMTSINKTDRCVFGLSTLDIYTGKCFIHEYDVQKYKHQTTSYDELERFYTVFRPSEVIFIYDGLTNEMVNDIIKYLNISVSIRKINLCEDDFLL